MAVVVASKDIPYPGFISLTYGLMVRKYGAKPQNIHEKICFPKGYLARVLKSLMGDFFTIRLVLALYETCFGGFARFASASGRGGGRRSFLCCESFRPSFFLFRRPAFLARFSMALRRAYAEHNAFVLQVPREEGKSAEIRDPPLLIRPIALGITIPSH